MLLQKTFLGISSPQQVSAFSTHYYLSRRESSFFVWSHYSTNVYKQQCQERHVVEEPQGRKKVQVLSIDFFGSLGGFFGWGLKKTIRMELFGACKLVFNLWPFLCIFLDSKQFSCKYIVCALGEQKLYKQQQSLQIVVQNL